MNESTLSMIEKIHARLNDLTEVVEEIPFELNGYDQKLDRIDDQVYLIEVALEKKLKNSIKIEPISEDKAKEFALVREGEDAKSNTSVGETTQESDVTSSKKTTAPKMDNEKDSLSISGDEEEDDGEEGFLTDSAKEKIAGATKTLNTIYREGKETFGDLSEAFGDIKDAFGGTKSFFKKH